VIVVDGAYGYFFSSAFSGTLSAAMFFFSPLTDREGWAMAMTAAKAKIAASRTYKSVDVSRLNVEELFSSVCPRHEL